MAFGLNDLIRANPLLGALDAVGPEIETFLGSGNERSECHLGPKNVEINNILLR